MKYIKEIKLLGKKNVELIIARNLGRSAVAAILGNTERYARNVIEEIRSNPATSLHEFETQLKVKSGNKADDAAKARDKKILELATRGGLSHKEIAEKVGCGRSTVGHILKRLGFTGETTKPVTKEVAKVDVKVEVKTDTPVTKPTEQKKYKWMMGTRFLTIVDDSDKRTYSVSHGNQHFKRACDLVTAGDIEGALALINVRKGISNYTRGHVTINGEKVFYKNLEIDSGITGRIIAAMQAGEEFEFLVKFFEKLMANPSNRAVTELYGFLQHNDLVIDGDGDVLAFKRVADDYKDLYSGSMDNSPGLTVEVERNQVNEDSNVTCSHGLHVAAKSYIPHYHGGSGRVLVVKVSPADFVSIPKDYNNAKARVCKYIVLDDITDGFDNY